MLDIINDILSISRIELGEKRLNEADLDIESTISAVARLVMVRAREKSIELAVRVDPSLPRLMADERAVKQVLLNIIANAVKFTNTGGRVVVSAHLRDEGNLAIVVADDGIGIAAESISKVVEPFFQPTPRSSAVTKGSVSACRSCAI